jgi:hypothetical protein
VVCIFKWLKNRFIDMIQNNFYLDISFETRFPSASITSIYIVPL